MQQISLPRPPREFVDVEYTCEWCAAVHTLQVYSDGRVIDIFTDAELQEG